MSKEEKERIQREQKEAEEIHIKALGMLKDASKLNRAIGVDMEKNPERYINLLKRKVFNPHKCNITEDPYSKMPYQERKRILHNRTWKCGNFSLLYAILSNWIKDENMTIMECERIYQKCGFSCMVPSGAEPVQKTLYRLYTNIKKVNASLLHKVEERLPKITLSPNDRYAKLFIEYWDYEWVANNTTMEGEAWNYYSLEEIVELGRQGAEVVKRPRIPWETRAREICHTFMGGSEYAYYDEPAPEKIRYSYLQDFQELLKLNVHMGQKVGTRNEDGVEIGFTLFVDESNIVDLPIDWQKVQIWTQEEETEFRRREEEEKRDKEESDKFIKELLERRNRRSGREEL